MKKQILETIGERVTWRSLGIFAHFCPSTSWFCGCLAFPLFPYLSIIFYIIFYRFNFCINFCCPRLGDKLLGTCCAGEERRTYALQFPRSPRGPVMFFLRVSWQSSKNRSRSKRFERVEGGKFESFITSKRTQTCSMLWLTTGLSQNDDKAVKQAGFIDFEYPVLQDQCSRTDITGNFCNKSAPDRANLCQRHLSCTESELEHLWERLALIDFVMFVWLVHACANSCLQFQQRYVQSLPIAADCSLFFVSWACRFRLLPHAQHRQQEWHSSESETFMTHHHTYQTSCQEVASLLPLSPFMSLCSYLCSISLSLLSFSLIFSLVCLPCLVMPCR